MQARLSEAEDVPVVGISRMFYKVYADALLSNADAMFWYEHDVYAIRPHWVDALHREALVAGRFWVRGSVTRTASLDASIACKTEVPREIPAGDAPPISTLLWESHINGAALFSLRDPAFASAVAEANRSFPEAAYDVAIHAVVADHRRHFASFREHAHLLQYSEVVQARPEDFLAFDRPSPGLDRFRSDHPRTYLVHGVAMARWKRLQHEQRKHNLTACMPNSSAIRWPAPRPGLARWTAGRRWQLLVEHWRTLSPRAREKIERVVKEEAGGGGGRRDGKPKAKRRDGKAKRRGGREAEVIDAGQSDR